jgi:threonine dehydrogenase-like Zn-dependent dehydrogenase
VERDRGTLVALPVGKEHALMPSLLTLTDVMATGHHAAVSARVGPGKTVAVVGGGAVGLCGVIAAKRLGAEQIILLDRHSDRIALAKEFGATDIVSERGEEAVERVRELTKGLGVQSVLECVGYEESTLTALSIARPGGAVGRVGVPQDELMPAATATFFSNTADPPQREHISRNCYRMCSKIASNLAASSTGLVTSIQYPLATAQ